MSDETTNDVNTTTTADTTTTNTTTAPNGGDTTPKGHVPYPRFSEKVAEVALWKATVEDLRKQVAEVDVWKAKATDLETQFSQARTTWEEDRAFTQAGLADEEAADLARYYYNKLSEKPEGGIGAWLAAAKADPTTAPKALAAYLAPAPDESQAKPTTRAPAGPQVAATGRPAPAGGSVTVDALRAAREHGQRTGDWSSFQTLSQSVVEDRRKV